MWAQHSIDEWVFAPLFAPDGEPVVRVELKRDWIVIESAKGGRWAKRLSIALRAAVNRLTHLEPS